MPLITHRHVLMVSFFLPPFSASSGIQRTLRFSQYLPEYGWQPILLGPSARAYSSRNEESVREISSGVPVYRAFALDAARHLAIRGRFPGLLAVPDRFSSWTLGAIPLGLKLIRQFRPRAIWSTYPIASAHFIAHALARITGVPWVADFRDPMIYESWPETPMMRRAHEWLERKAAEHASRCVFVSPSALEMFVGRHPQSGPRAALIPNGFDNAVFESLPPSGVEQRHDGIRLLHAGVLDVPDRDPSTFFQAIREMKLAGEIRNDELKITLRAAGSEQLHRATIERLGLSDIVTLEPGVPYQAALAEMRNSDGLLLFQGPQCNRQIPAKLYEYMGAGKPIFAIVDPRGDTHRQLRDAGVETIGDFSSAEDLRRAFTLFLSGIRAGSLHGVAPDVSARFARKELTRQLADLLTDATSVVSRQ